MVEEWAVIEMGFLCLFLFIAVEAVLRFWVDFEILAER
ncbi:hypothetical protein COLO4_32889 [Corchorus olitorius]|uniref:Uncharacterized protein n=1 Tax=Corchorus olitorius TaxID=93759 RepID=A0A1R3GXG1_9ROSI|nr:hypothetical protein COLO4_32889 [Corchorus olitorius]